MLFVTDKGYLYMVPMKRKGEALQVVRQFAKEVGVPDANISDMAREQLSQEVKHFCNLIWMTLHALEEGTPGSNHVELYIKLMKEAVHKDMGEADSLLEFWDYCLECCVRIYNLTAWDHHKVHGTNPYTIMTGKEEDISSVSQYGWYQWCYYWEHTNSFPDNQVVLGQVLGPVCGEGNEMAQWNLKANGNVVPRRSHHPLQVAKIHSLFDDLIERRWGTSISLPSKPVGKSNDPMLEIYEDNSEERRTVPDIEDSVDSNGRLVNQLPAYAHLLNVEVQRQLGKELTTGRVKCHALGPEGKVVGKYDDNPFLNSMTYEVEFVDGQVQKYSANVIAENMLTRVDSEGLSTTLMEGIVDCHKDESVAVMKTDICLHKEWPTAAEEDNSRLGHAGQMERPDRVLDKVE